MADNTSQTGTDTIATDDIGGVKYQRTKVNFGVDGSSTDASATNPLPTNHIAKYTDESGNNLTVTKVFANVSASATDSSIVTATASKKIRVLHLVMVTGSTATNVTFNSKGAGAGTAISPLFANAANSGAVLPDSQYGWFESNSGEGLTCTTGAGSATAVLIAYALV